MSANRNKKLKCSFIEEVLSIKHEHGSIKKILYDPKNRRSFLENNAIYEYLTRSSDDIDFENDHPLLKYDKANKIPSDYYELKIYRTLDFFQKNYRDVENPAFYREEGNKTLKSIINKEILRFNESHKDNIIYILDINDIYHIRHTLNAISYPIYSSEFATYLPKNFTIPTPYKFILSQNWKDNHATTLVSILDEVTN